MIDKSRDYLYQNSTITVLYLAKTSEGNATFNTNSVGAFTAMATPVPYVVKNAVTRDGELQVDHGVFNLWRSVCGTVVPALGDKLYDGITFWLVDQVEFMDRDDSQQYQRYRLSCTRTKAVVVL